jgi:hypothetical protein
MPEILENTTLALHRLEAIVAGAGAVSLTSEDFDVLQDPEAGILVAQIGWEG